MRYRIEFLKESTDEYSVCKTAEVESDLDGAELQARLEAERIKALFASGGFQIRDLKDGGRIVALGTFDNPLGRFWPDAGHRVVH